jgi:GxxExxY protein
MDFEAMEVNETGGGVVYPDESYQIVGACFAVYKELGCGFLEAVYQESLAIELGRRRIDFQQQMALPIEYAGTLLAQLYLADFVCFGKIIIEIKAVKDLSPEHRAQTMNYLKATGFSLGLLLNFGHYPKLEYERIVCTTGRYVR